VQENRRSFIEISIQRDIERIILNIANLSSKESSSIPDKLPPLNYVSGKFDSIERSENRCILLLFVILNIKIILDKKEKDLDYFIL
jgi:hypothetical protein